MCGIMGMVLNQKQRSDDDLELLRMHFADLLVATQVRGRNATGAFTVNPSGIRYTKAPGSAKDFVFSLEFWGLMDTITEETTAVVGHTRFATKGCPTCNANNHPINIDSLTGVHNGVLYNDDDIRDQYPYDQEVDSAAIFALLSGRAKGNPITADLIANSLPKLEGDMAIAVADNRSPDKLFVARDDSRPLFLANDNTQRVTWMASTSSILRQGLRYVDIANPQPLPDFSVATLTSGANIDIKKWNSK